MFERGPRGFRPSGPAGTEVLRLLDDLGLHTEAIGTDPASSAQWLWLEGRLQAAPGSLTALMTSRLGLSRLGLRLVAAVLQEPFRPARRRRAGGDGGGVT
jgi:protoporphyrinogen oxidase